MTRVIWASLLIFLTVQNGFAETWISIGDRPMRLRKGISCRLRAKHDAVSQCDCCLLKNLNARDMSLTAAVDRCISSFHCNYPKRASEEHAKALLRNAERRLKAMSIININKIFPELDLPEDGHLSGEEVKNILHKLNDAGFLQLPRGLFVTEKNHQSLLNVKTLGEEGVKGIFSGQLFAVTYDRFTDDKKTTRPLFILKETKKGLGEIENLYKVSSSNLFSEKISTEQKHFSGMPEIDTKKAAIAFDEIHFKIKANGDKRYFSLLQTAEGRSFYSHLKEFGELAKVSDSNDETYLRALKIMKTMFFDIGFSLSELHRAHAQEDGKRERWLKKTFIHGDVHASNIFYSVNSRKVTLIDNETFALSLRRPSSGVNDLVDLYMLHTVHTIAHAVATQLTTNEAFGIDDHLWHELWRSLFDGYLSAYGELSHQEYKQLFSQFKHKFIRGFSQSRIFMKAPRQFIDQRNLKRLGPTGRLKHLLDHEIPATFDLLYDKKMKAYSA